jgi:hypothetical protein
MEMKIRIFFKILSVLGLILFFGSCSASRSIIHSGKVTSEGAIKGGFHFNINLATQPAKAIFDIQEVAVDAINGRDSIYYSSEIKLLSKAALAYSLDPVRPNMDFYLRYGIYERFDIGYKKSGKVHVFDGMYQFLGPTEGDASSGDKKFFGSVRIQYSSQKSDLPEKIFIDKIPFLNYSAKRKDILIPLVFSYSFGENEEFGNFSFGGVYNHSFIEYGFGPSKIYTYSGLEIPNLMRKNNFGSIGGFINAKLGFKYLYILPAFAVYYQNYGKYEILADDFIELKGMTFIPSIGIQFKTKSFKKVSGSENEF